MPGAAIVGDQLVALAVGADQVMRTDLAAAVGAAQRIQALLHGMLVGVVQHDDHRHPCVVVGRWHPRGKRIALFYRRTGAGGQQRAGKQQGQVADHRHAPIVPIKKPAAPGPPVTAHAGAINKLFCSKQVDQTS